VHKQVRVIAQSAVEAARNQTAGEISDALETVLENKSTN
jgi:hypothetical protein